MQEDRLAHPSICRKLAVELQDPHKGCRDVVLAPLTARAPQGPVSLLCMPPDPVLSLLNTVTGLPLKRNPLEPSHSSLHCPLSPPFRSKPSSACFTLTSPLRSDKIALLKVGSMLLSPVDPSQVSTLNPADHLHHLYTLSSWTHDLASFWALLPP